MHADRDAEIDRNFRYFIEIVGDLVNNHSGQFVLVRDCSVVSYFNSSTEALKEAYKKYPDGIFAIQEVVEEPLDLGFYSHVANTGKGHE